ncbi:serine acetyltransferase [Flavobacterium galactosidilyticum]|uniref:PglD-related sugar-binding protein n=1 Tax=Flavobacterium galactosidilyticum TaxID=2893886 RepID=UPI001E325602|nr:serine acetyltransferase [Flavobacterium sp. F-340]UFH46672.1 serine acetyltransferase [Flavobacterium sp. F-340]
MEDILIIGASGLGKEVAYYIKSINKINPRFKIIGFIDDNPNVLGSDIIYGIKVVGNLSDILSNRIEVKNICIAIANNTVRTSIVEKLKDMNFIFPNIIDPSVDFDNSNRIGLGNIIGHHVMFTCNISIGNFNILNGTSGFGHDVTIGDFNLFGPRTSISGCVKIGKLNTFNLNSSIIQNITVGDRNTVNLHSCLFKSIKDDGVYFGVPAMKQKF